MKFRDLRLGDLFIRFGALNIKDSANGSRVLFTDASRAPLERIDPGSDVFPATLVSVTCERIQPKLSWDDLEIGVIYTNVKETHRYIRLQEGFLVELINGDGWKLYPYTPTEKEFLPCDT